jgi:TniQ protein
VTTRLSPLPMQVRPNLGEGLASYIRRLARTNHLPPKELASFIFPEGNSAADLDSLAQLTNRTVDALRRALVDAPGRAAPLQGKDSLFPTMVDRKLTNLSHRVDLVLLLFDALHDGVPRHVLHHRYGLLPRRLVRIALQHQPPRQFKRRGPDARILFKTINQLPLDDT